MTDTALDTKRTGAGSSRRVLVGSSVGTLVEFYDYSIYALSVPVLSLHFFPSHDPITGILSALAVFALAFVVRPIGGVIFGILGDRIGRRRVLVTVLVLIGVATSLIGFLPGYQQIGILAPILLIALRLLQGISAGGEVTSATSFALEHAPETRRATWITTIVSMSALASICGLSVVLALGAVMGDQAFADWGWRIPFLITLPLSLVGLYVRLKTEESPLFTQAQERRELSAAPLREAIRNDRAAIGYTTALASMTALAFYYLAGYFPTYLQVTAGMSRSDALFSNGVALLAFAVGIIAAGALSDRWGRRRMLRLGAATLVVVSVPAFHLAALGGLGALFGQLLIVLGLVVFGGSAYTTMLELFPTRTRLTGASLGYNIGYAIFGGSAALVAAFMVELIGSPQAPGFYLLAVGLIVFIATYKIPETRWLTIDR